jgi:hypothetical protein
MFLLLLVVSAYGYEDMFSGLKALFGRQKCTSSTNSAIDSKSYAS